MRDLRSWSSRFAKRWLLAASAAALVSTAAQALPRTCDQVCRPRGSCNWICNDSDTGIYIITCGEWGLCNGAGRQVSGASGNEGLPAFELDEPAQPATQCAGIPADRTSLMELLAE